MCKLSTDCDCHKQCPEGSLRERKVHPALEGEAAAAAAVAERKEEEKGEKKAVSLTERVRDALWGAEVENDPTPNLFAYVRNWVKFGVPQPQTEPERQQLVWLFGFFALCALFWGWAPDTASWCFNPWRLGVVAWVFWFQAKQKALETANKLMMAFLERRGYAKLAYGETESGQEVLEGRKLKPLDFFFFRVNAVFDMVFLSHLTYHLWCDEAVVRVWDTTPLAVGQYVLLSLVSWPIIMVTGDTYYSFLHWLMHKEPLYTAIHQIHHEIVIPDRGLVDVRSYSPIEIFLSSFTILFSLNTPGVTVLAGALAFSTQVMANIANHSDYDLRISVAGRTLFHTGNHEMHHRYPRTNMGIVSMLSDIHFLNTFMPYKEN